MKICILGHYPSDTSSFAGVSRVVYNLSHSLSHKHPNVFLIKKKRTRHYLRKNTFHKEGTLPVYTLSHMGMAFHLLKKQYDVVNIHNMSSYFIIPFILKKLHLIRSKIVFVSHGLVHMEMKENRYHYPFRYQLYQKMSLRYSDKIIAVSESLMEDIHNYYSIDKNKISVVTNAVDDSFFEQCKSPNSIINEKYILFVGDITKVKGVDFLLDAIKKVDICLVLVGKKSSYLSELKNIYSDLFNSGKVVVLENLDDEDLKSLYCNSLFFILLSRHEPYGLVVLEAMASGRPVIISDNVGAKEIIEQGKEGFIVSVENLDSVIQKMDYLIRNENLATLMGTCAKNKALQHKWKTKSQEYYDLFLDLIK